MVLERYFSLAGQETELVLPKNLDLQEKLKTGPPRDIDFFPEEFEGWQFSFGTQSDSDSFNYIMLSFLTQVA